MELHEISFFVSPSDVCEKGEIFISENLIDKIKPGHQIDVQFTFENKSDITMTLTVTGFSDKGDTCYINNDDINEIGADKDIDSVKIYIIRNRANKI